MAGRETKSDLITLAVAGDRPALERLLLGYADRLHTRIARKVPVDLHSRMSADDVLQETFIEAFRCIDTLKPMGDLAFYRWLATVAEHRLQDAIKARRAAKRGGGWARQEAGPAADSSSTGELVELLVGAVDTPSRSAARHEAAMAVQVGLASLKEDYRHVIELRYVKGLPVADVAVTMGRTPDAVKNLCRRGLAELQAVLGRSSQYLSRR